MISNYRGYYSCNWIRIHFISTHIPIVESVQRVKCSSWDYLHTVRREALFLSMLKTIIRANRRLHFSSKHYRANGVYIFVSEFEYLATNQNRLNKCVLNSTSKWLQWYNFVVIQMLTMEEFMWFFLQWLQIYYNWNWIKKSIKKHYLLALILVFRFKLQKCVEQKQIQCDDTLTHRWRWWSLQ